LATHADQPAWFATTPRGSFILVCAVSRDVMSMRERKKNSQSLRMLAMAVLYERGEKGLIDAAQAIINHSVFVSEVISTSSIIFIVISSASVRSWLAGCSVVAISLAALAADWVLS